MQKFTIKDFISYCSPCFSCNNNVSLKIGLLKIRAEAINKYLIPPLYARPAIGNNNIELDLKITYKTILKLKIFLQDNTFETSSAQALTDYLVCNNLFMESNCDVCHSSFDSKILRFNLKNKYIYPLELKTESLTVTTDDRVYYVRTDFKKNTTVIDIYYLNDNKDHIRFDLPLFPLSSFKTKERFLNKMKTLLIFS